MLWSGSRWCVRFCNGLGGRAEGGGEDGGKERRKERGKERGKEKLTGCIEKLFLRVTERRKNGNYCFFGFGRVRLFRFSVLRMVDFILFIYFLSWFSLVFGFESYPFFFFFFFFFDNDDYYCFLVELVLG